MKTKVFDAGPDGGENLERKLDEFLAQWAKDHPTWKIRHITAAHNEGFHYTTYTFFYEEEMPTS